MQVEHGPETDYMDLLKQLEKLSEAHRAYLLWFRER